MSAPSEDLVAKLEESGWPPECVESYRKFGVPVAVLYPYLEHEVITPRGPGILKQLIAGEVAVVLKSEADRAARAGEAGAYPGQGTWPEMVRFPWRSVRPSGAPRRPADTGLRGAVKPRIRKRKQEAPDAPLFFTKEDV